METAVTCNKLVGQWELTGILGINTLLHRQLVFLLQQHAIANLLTSTLSLLHSFDAPTFLNNTTGELTLSTSSCGGRPNVYNRQDLLPRVLN